MGVPRVRQSEQSAWRIRNSGILATRPGTLIVLNRSTIRIRSIVRNRSTIMIRSIVMICSTIRIRSIVMIFSIILLYSIIVDRS